MGRLCGPIESLNMKYLKYVELPYYIIYSSRYAVLLTTEKIDLYLT